LTLRDRIHARILPWVDASLEAGAGAGGNAPELCDILLELTGGQGERLRFGSARPTKAELDHAFAARWQFFCRGAGLIS
jgi:hypothetical protein